MPRSRDTPSFVESSAAESASVHPSPTLHCRGCLGSAEAMASLAPSKSRPGGENSLSTYFHPPTSLISENGTPMSKQRVLAKLYPDHMEKPPLLSTTPLRAPHLPDYCHSLLEGVTPFLLPSTTLSVI